MSEDVILKASVKAYQNAKDRRTANAQAERIFHCILPYVAYLVKPFALHGIGGYDRDDLMQVAFMGVFCAIERYEPRSDVKFKSFVSRVVHLRMLQLYGNHKKRSNPKHSMSLRELLNRAVLRECQLLRLALLEEKQILLAQQTVAEPKAMKKKILRIKRDIQAPPDGPVQRLDTMQMFPSIEAAANAVKRPKSQIRQALKIRIICAGTKWQWVSSA